MDELETLLSRSDTPEGIADALKRERGARQYRCALQVNPFDYGQRHAKKTSYADETSYNAAMVEACLDNDVEVVAITDHFRFDSSVGLADALHEAGIHVFPGFEANSSEGIHLLCVFPESEDASGMNRYIGLCGVRDLSDDSPQSDKTAEQICSLVADAGGLAIAAHATSASGLLKVLSGKSRARAWKNPHLYAAAVAGSRDSVQQSFRSIVNNKDVTTKRDRSLAIINANDVNDPDQFADNSSSTLIKMSEVSIEGLRQAFLDHQSRIQLNSEAIDTPHTEVIAVAWAGGLLDGESVRLNPGLNVLIGGRGSGKSTFIESIRYALDLDPRGSEAKRSHVSIIKDVIKSGTEISVLIHSPYPAPQHYLIRRIHGNAPKVYNQSGELLPDLKPADVVGNLEVYGQHEISELTRQSGEIAEILRRFIVSDEEDDPSEIISELSDNGVAIVAEIEKIERLDSTLSVLPELREKRKRFEAVKLDKKLESKTLIDEEEGAFEALEEEILALEERAESLCLDQYDDVLPEDWENRALNPETLRQVGRIQDRLISASTRARDYLLAISQQARAQSEQIEASWQSAKEKVESDYNKTLRELNKKGEDGSAYVKIRKQIADLVPKEKQRSTAQKSLGELRTKRKILLATFEQEKAKDRRSLEKAAKRVSRKLKGKVRVEIHDSVDLSSLESLISSHVSGKFVQAMTKLGPVAV